MKILNQQKRKNTMPIKEYYGFLEDIHKKLKPEVYLEVGLRYGDSLSKALPDTIALGIDPVINMKAELSPNTTLYKMTSDEFFEKYKKELPCKKKIDLAFIDGMHLFDYALRDFINIEKHSSKDAVILFHDTIPRDKVTSSRKRTTNHWTGDVFKVILILKKYRPELEIYNFNSPPSGLAAIKNLDPDSTVLEENYEKILEEYMEYPYSNLETGNKKEILNIVEDNILF